MGEWRVSENGPVRITRRFKPQPLSPEQQERRQQSRLSYIQSNRASRFNPNDPNRFASHEQRKTVYARDKGRCVYCQRPVTFNGANIDHLIPWPEGKTELPNLVLACRGCNKAKGTYRPHKYIPPPPTDNPAANR